MKNQFFAVSWCGNIRYSDRVADANAAARNCFGISSPTMKIEAISNPRYMTAKAKAELHDRLKTPA
jgi:hypothetical protein